jgi:tRNA(fMet)-specific endonuclease VapC
VHTRVRAAGTANHGWPPPRGAPGRSPAAILAVVGVQEYDLDVARTHARLLAHTLRQGKPRGAHDLIIAATAAATARSVVTYDKQAAFADLPGVRVAALDA